MEPAAASADAARIPRPVAALIVGAIVLATLAALLWPSLPFDEARRVVVGPTKVGIIVAQVESGGAGRINEMAPDFEWVAPDGQRLRLSSLRGRPVVINFWATWCLPCRNEMPLLDAAAARDPVTAFLAVDLDEDGDAVRAFFDDMGLQHLEPLIDIGLTTARRYGLASVPSTFFVDRGGAIRHMHIGEMDAEKLERGLERIR